ncbi:hypothetical protein RFI_05130 [Reticulomyxa filosa]|uniref:Uncharacterized protein n=1 Tax=Reticulomyxa filosa TaxID=46433 RepID=X6P348_RETFI|nr:hypothetical protein RFI_05130 [Reticulomyxa filosa]|eukprot:ETO31987.1 hypothetical protein RFI_05130 [Reticulomyxa filosa]
MIFFKNEKQTSTQPVLDGFMILTNLWPNMLCFFCFNSNQMFEYSFFIITHYHNLTQAISVFRFDTFHSSYKLPNGFHGHTGCVNSIDHSIFNSVQFLCSGSDDKTVRIWDIETNKQIQSFTYSNNVCCVKFSPYHYHNHRRNVICSSSIDKKIYFWDVKDNKQFQIFNGHTNSVNCIGFSSFNGGRYLCSGSGDCTICLWDVETSKTLHYFYGHGDSVSCAGFSPLQSNSNENNSIGVIGGSGYTICSGSRDKNICVWDVETTKKLLVFKGHALGVKDIKYGSDELGVSGGTNTILSGSYDASVRLWDVRSGQQIQLFEGHRGTVMCVEYSPFVVNNKEIGNSNVICSGSLDNTIRFCDVRSDKRLSILYGDYEEDWGIFCIKFLQLKKEKKSKRNNGRCCDIGMCYGSGKGPIHVWG